MKHSAIHGRGLYARHAIAPGEMVLEYRGVVIRRALADLREHSYIQRGERAGSRHAKAVSPPGTQALKHVALCGSALVPRPGLLLLRAGRRVHHRRDAEGQTQETLAKPCPSIPGMHIRHSHSRLNRRVLLVVLLSGYGLCYTQGTSCRYLNHSCEPNCIARHLTIDGHKRIMIFSQRDIVFGAPRAPSLLL